MFQNPKFIDSAYKERGKTYSLFTDEKGSDRFYKVLDGVMMTLIEIYGNEERVLELVKKNPVEIEIFINQPLKIFLEDVEKHRSGLKFTQRFSDVLNFRIQEYINAMVESELYNRIYKERFRQCKIKIAFLPHCLRDLSRECKSEIKGLDYRCKFCSDDCFINKVSRILLKSGITPYIWKTASIKSVIKNYRKKKETLGIFGIACIPELLHGMRHCVSADVPVMGMPLDGNKCERWKDKFYPNSISLKRLEYILK